MHAAVAPHMHPHLVALQGKSLHRLWWCVQSSPMAFSAGSRGDLQSSVCCIADHSLFVQGSGPAQAADWVELGNGCLCCSVKSEFVRALDGLAERKGQFDYILVETTGRVKEAL